MIAEQHRTDDRTLVLEELTDEELERELTLAALSERRERRFRLLLHERERRSAMLSGRS